MEVLLEYREVDIGGRAYSMDEQGNILSIYKTESGLIKTFPDKDGYLKAAIVIRKKTNNRFVHRLVYEAWVGEIPEGMTVDHIDGDKSNNHYTMVSPTGEVVEIYNMKKFCKAHGLHPSHMAEVCAGKPKYNQHKGWTKYV